MRLVAGKHYRLPNGDIIEALEVTEACAVVRPATKKRIEFETAVGEYVEFDKYSRTFTISANSALEEVEG